MELRERFAAEMKASMLARTAERTGTIRMIMAKLKDGDIAARPKGVDKISDDEIVGLLRSMVKSRRESMALYEQGNRPELAVQEAAEIAIIEEFLPQTLAGEALDAAVRDAIAATNAASPKDMGKVIGALKAKFGSALDMAATSSAAKALLGG
ncbi:MAG: aspartyl-tRNA amidotransferase [Rhodospirillales bacterium 20-60-12]|nr:MAG: aspartyl-tRNA amidotransferase [Rhodospirillales bacterium 20-60-12]HQT66089.1 GatB/YqeY domain-containing protein [Acetobacteraceae bacterium]HQU02616.1 GatB/YqeY domain-containing protein [Acetobacteraceae bacterium]